MLETYSNYWTKILQSHLEIDQISHDIKWSQSTIPELQGAWRFENVQEFYRTDAGEVPGIILHRQATKVQTIKRHIPH